MSIKITKQSNKAQTHPKTTPAIAGTSPPSDHHAGGYTPIIDKLSITLKPVNKQHAHAIHSGIWTQFDDTSVFQSGGMKTSGFNAVKLIALPGIVERPHFQYAHAEGLAQKLRVELNPSSLGTDGLTKLHAVLVSLVPDGWGYFIKYSKISRIDIAVDVPGLRMNQFLFLPQQGLTMRQWAVNGHLETMTFGKSTGNQTRVYSKKKEQLAKGKPFPGASVIRIERTLRNPKIGALKKLGQLENPFAKMMMSVNTLGPPPGEKLNSWTMFEDSVNVRGVTAALALLSEERRTRYRKHLKQHPHALWNPDAIWAKWPDTLNELSLINPETFF